ncbi:MAG: hypothetical protein IJQ99_08570 [Synergistaceae bacterium]|nr:hypothetical protein [Synergistaceae bacterium]MBR0253949.1 hypothetical protein [Synergistaceae bacterium]MBR0316902.1 hypothetical protein [Synergistaceae bacterium]
MGKDERIQKILDSWRGSQRLKEDTWQNVLLVLDYYGFKCERKKEWVCRHEDFSELAKDHNAKDLLRRVGLGVSGDFSIAVTHGSNRKAGMVIQRYLKIILNAIEFLEFLRGKEKKS